MWITAVWSLCGIKPCESCTHKTFVLFLTILSCSKFRKSLLSYNQRVCHAHRPQMFHYLFCETLVLLVQDLIKVLTLEDLCIIAQGLMSVHHIAQIRDCRWNGHTFHAPPCCVWMDARTFFTKMYSVSICAWQIVVKICAWDNSMQPVVHFFLCITPGDGNNITSVVQINYCLHLKICVHYMFKKL